MNPALVGHALAALVNSPTYDDAVEDAFRVVRECYRHGDRGIPWESCSRDSVERAICFVWTYLGPNGPRA